MQINSISSNSFGARLTRNSEIIDTGKNRYYQTTSKYKSIEAYDNLIDKFEKQKKFVSEFDDYMNTPEIQRIIDELPIDDELEIDTMPNITVNDDESITLNKPGLFYNTADFEQEKILRKSDSNLMSFRNVQKEDGSLNKEGIINYLNRLVDFFNN